MHKKHNKKKNAQHFPLREGKKKAVTVRLPVVLLQSYTWSLDIGGVTMAPSPPYRRGSNRPRVDSQQETGNPGRRNPQRQGGGAPLRPVYRRCTFPNAYMLCKKKRARRTHTDHNKQQPKHRPTQTHPRRNQPEPRQETRKTPSRQTSDDEKKKKNRRGAKPWGSWWARSTGWRRSPRPGCREHKGKPKPQRGLGFPSAWERERERKERERERDTASTKIPDKEKNEEDRQLKNKHGSGREGLKGPKTYTDPWEITTAAQRTDKKLQSQNNNPT